MNEIEIRKLRKSLNLSQKGFGKLLGVTYLSVNRWENGISKPGYLSQEKLENLKHKSKDNNE